MSFLPIPAIDLRGGCVVRLQQGDYARQTTYPVGAAELAARYAAAGARWIHVVDLDGARDGALANAGAIRAIAKTGLAVQAGGGVRNEDDLLRLFDAGVRRVVLGSVAIREPARVADWLGRHGGERLVIALDTRRVDGQWTLPSAGWTEVEAVRLEQLAPWYAAAGARHLLCTDIDRDGMLGGINIALYRYLGELAPALAVQASGGVRSLEDVRAARDAGAAAVILGRALLEGRVNLPEALAC